MLFLMIVVQPVTRAGQLVAEIERRIANQALPPGTFLGTRASLRLESGLAKATVNEAVRLLSERGLVTVRPGRGGGLFVAEDNALVRLRHTLFSVPSGASSVADVIAVRDALESLVASVAARHCSDADAATLRQHVERLRLALSAGDDERFLRANWALHEAIASIGPNAYLRAVYLGTVSTISDVSSGARIEIPAGKAAYLQLRVHVHVELVEAVVAGDLARVEAAVARHADAEGDQARAVALGG